MESKQTQQSTWHKKALKHVRKLDNWRSISGYSIFFSVEKKKKQNQKHDNNTYLSVLLSEWNQIIYLAAQDIRRTEQITPPLLHYYWEMF